MCIRDRGDRSKADKYRADEESIYTQEQEDLKATIDTFEQVIVGLEAAANDQFLQNGKRASSKAAVQMVLVLAQVLVTDTQKAVVTKLLQASPHAKSTGRMRKYDSKSCGGDRDAQEHAGRLQAPAGRVHQG